MNWKDWQALYSPFFAKYSAHNYWYTIALPRCEDHGVGHWGLNCETA